MAKYTNRLKARLAMQRLEESAKEGKNWIVTKKLILETEEGDLELNPGDNLEIGGTDDGDLAVGSKAAVVIITEPEIAQTVADAVVNADELSDVEFVTKDAMDALEDGEPLDDVVDALGDEEGEGTEVEVPEVTADKKESVEAKYAKFAAHRMNPEKAIVCESVLVEEDASERLNLHTIKTFGTFKESFEDYKKFTARVAELNGSIQPGKREIALTEAGEVMGSYDTEANAGELFPENSFENVEAMDSYEDEPMSVMSDEAFDGEDWQMDPEAENEEVLEACLRKYEESAKTGSDYMQLAESLTNEKLGLKESTIAKIVSTFDSRLLNECVRVYDSKYGKFVACFKESADASNFIAETNVEKRFTKRFFG